MEPVNILILHDGTSFYEGRAIYSQLVSALRGGDDSKDTFIDDNFIIRFRDLSDADQTTADLVYYPHALVEGTDYDARYNNMLLLSRVKRDGIIAY